MKNSTANIKTEIIEVTPKLAREWLANGSTNRRVSDVYSRRYENDIINNRWGINHQGICFREDGKLMDGQHRLVAIARSGKAVPVMVTTGMPVEWNGIKVMDTVDSGRKRTVSTQLGLEHDVSNASLMTACCNMVVRVVSGAYNPPTVTASIAVEMLKQLEPSFQKIGALATFRKRRAATVGPIGMYHFSKPRKAVEFAHAYFDLEDLNRNHPALALHRWVESVGAPSGASKRYRIRHLASLCYSLRMYDAGETVDRMSYSEDHIEWLRNLHPGLRDAVKELFHLK